MQEEKDTALGELLRRLRGSLSVKKLAALSGVSRKTIDNVEAGQNISVLVLKKLLRALGVEEITLRVHGLHEARATDGLGQADVRAISDALKKASVLLETATQRMDERGRNATDDVSNRAEDLIERFSSFVRTVGDVEALERLQQSVTSLCGAERKPARNRRRAGQRRERRSG